MRKLRLRAEAAITRIELADGMLDQLIDQAGAELAGSSGESFAVFDSRHYAARCVGDLVALGLPDIGHSAEHALEAGASVALFGWKVSAAEVWLAVGSKDCSQRPASLAGHGLHRRLVAAVNVGAFV